MDRLADQPAGKSCPKADRGTAEHTEAAESPTPSAAQEIVSVMSNDHQSKSIVQNVTEGFNGPPMPKQEISKGVNSLPSSAPTGNAHQQVSRSTPQPPPPPPPRK